MPIVIHLKLYIESKIFFPPLHIHVFIIVIPDQFSLFIPFISFFNIKHHPWGKNKRKTDINFSSQTPRRYLNHINLPRLLFIYVAWKGRKFFSKFTLVAAAENGSS